MPIRFRRIFTVFALLILAGSANVPATVARDIAAPAAPILVSTGQGAYFTVLLGTRLCVANAADDNISVLDAARNRVVATLPGPYRDLQAIAANPVTNRLYVSGNQTVEVVDPATGNILDRPIAVYALIDAGLAVDPATNNIYAGDADGNQIITIDGATDTAYLGAIGVMTVGNCVESIAPEPGTLHVFAANPCDGTVSDMDLDQDAPVATIPAGTDPEQVALDPGLHRLYVVDGQVGATAQIAAAYRGAIETYVAASGHSATG